MEPFEAFLIGIKEMKCSIDQTKYDLCTYKSENQLLKGKITDIIAELGRVKIEYVALQKQMADVKRKDETNKETLQNEIVRDAKAIGKVSEEEETADELVEEVSNEKCFETIQSDTSSEKSVEVIEAEDKSEAALVEAVQYENTEDKNEKSLEITHNDVLAKESATAIEPEDKSEEANVEVIQYENKETSDIVQFKIEKEESEEEIEEEGAHAENEKDEFMEESMEALELQNETGESVEIVPLDDKKDESEEDTIEKVELKTEIEELKEEKMEAVQSKGEDNESVEAMLCEDENGEARGLQLNPEEECKGEEGSSESNQCKNETTKDFMETQGYKYNADENLAGKVQFEYNEKPMEPEKQTLCNDEGNDMVKTVLREEQLQDESLETPQWKAETKTEEESLGDMQYNGEIEDERTVPEVVVAKRKLEAVHQEGEVEEPVTKTASIQSDEKMISLDKKVKKMCSRVEKSVSDFKIEFNTEMVKVRQDSHKLAQLQRVFNTVHIYLQSKIEQEASPNVPMPLLPPTPSRTEKHPSKVGISRSEAKKILENIKKSSFCVTLKEMPLLYKVPVCIEQYSKIEKHCDYMDPEAGVYTAPLKGRYECRIGRNTPSYKVELYLCMDKEEKRVDVSSNSQDSNGFYYKTVCVDCEVNDKMWLEASGRQQGYSDCLTGVVFRGKILS